MNPFIEKILGNLHENKRHVQSINNKNVFIIGKIHASWCGHCIALAPKWKKLMKIVKTKIPKHNLVISDIESENMETGLSILNQKYLSNSNEKVALQAGYPTIFKIVNGTIHYYEGPREVEPMLQWAMKDKPRFGSTKKIRSAKNKTRKMRN
jgi:thiol-disulfide isomerase/thioredoxin